MEKKTSSLQGSIGDKNFIQKKVTTSAKYGNVQSKLSGKTGASAKNVSTVSDNLVTKRKGEKHKRIKPSTLAKLMAESAYEESIYNLNEGMS